MINERGAFGMYSKYIPVDLRILKANEISTLQNALGVQKTYILVAFKINMSPSSNAV
jgi:HAMP domain-containing protein